MGWLAPLWRSRRRKTRKIMTIKTPLTDAAVDLIHLDHFSHAVRDLGLLCIRLEEENKKLLSELAEYHKSKDQQRAQRCVDAFSPLLRLLKPTV